MRRAQAQHSCMYKTACRVKFSGGLEVFQSAAIDAPVKAAVRRGWWISSGMSDIGVVILINTLFALLSIATSGLGFFDTDFFFPAGLWPVTAIVGSLAFIGLMRNLCKKGGVLPCLLVGYLIVVLMWPWPPFRFP